ncbi:MAG: sigma 54-interacting transcriptional regulator, partial [Desulfobacterales bacterium]|nr:sigma 54-interacting transcriptional regulator [Desulfobacterales bacterium]
MDTNPGQTDLLTIFLQSLLKLQNVERGSIWVKRNTDYRCILALDEHNQSEGIEGTVISGKQSSIVGWVIENGKMTISRAAEDSRHHSEIEKDFETKSKLIISFPLVLDTGEVYGALNLIDTTPTSSRMNLDKEYIELLQNIVIVGSIALSRSLAYSEQLKENKKLKTILDINKKSPRIIGKSQGILKALDKAETYAKVNYPVLITGESGTGKELFADKIHRLSPISDKPYLIQNCSAIPESLLESELFGHKKGAFTGAVEDRTGLFEAAEGGTVFLDEIGDMPINLQSKILRFLENGEIKMIGSVKSKKAKVRIITATNVDLEAAIVRKQFRQDLFYRLNVLPLPVPPLRERKDDIPLLLERFIYSESNSLGVKPKKVSPEAMRLITQYSWKGNVRELLNFARHIIIVTDDEVIKPETLPHYFLNDRPESVSTEQSVSSGTRMKSYREKNKALRDYTWHDLE